jgi:hypothetical protein
MKHLPAESIPLPPVGNVTATVDLSPISAALAAYNLRIT